VWCAVCPARVMCRMPGPALLFAPKQMNRAAHKNTCLCTAYVLQWWPTASQADMRPLQTCMLQGWQTAAMTAAKGR
jgi:hypothetical protein